MKGNIAILLLTITLLKFVCADPLVKSNSKSQVLRKDKIPENKNNDRKGHLREDDIPANIDTSIEEGSVLEDDNVGKIEGEATDTEELPAEDEEMADDEADSDQDEKETLNDNVIEPLAVGDTFTAGELLPVAQKLFDKVDHPGRGKGIISSSKSPQELADKIFQAFFLTTKRIVVLNDFDISGLDALQSLSLVGDPATSEKFAKRTHVKKDKKIINGQIVEVNRAGKKSRFKMLHKKSHKRASKRHAPKKEHVKRSRAFKKKAVIKRLGKKRQMVSHHKNLQNETNPKKEHAERRSLKKELLKRMGKNRHLVVQRKNMQNETSPSKNPCRWSYECKDPTDLDTCRLKAKCIPRKPNEKVDHAEYIYSKMLQNIDPKIIAQFRKSLSINALDEELEKIIESRVLKIKPQNMGSQEIEGLSEYFRKLMNLEGGGDGQSATTPMVGQDYDSDNIKAPETREESIEKLNAASLSVAKLDPQETSGEGTEDEAAGNGQKAEDVGAAESNARRAKKYA